MGGPIDAEHGLFLTTLVKEQTNVERREERRKAAKGEKSDPEFDRLARAESWRRPPCDDVERSFRHSGWWIERLRVATALVCANVPPSRRERFNECGSDCVVEWSPHRQKHRTRANYCGDRFCLPCARARAVRVRESVTALVGDCIPLLITLTIRNTPRTLTEALDHLCESFRRLRQQRGWQAAIKGGAAFVEIKRGQGSGHWHPHLHIIAVGSYLPGEALSRAWLKATGDSHRVKIERAASPEDGGRYATKYATKGWTSEVTRDLDSLVECILSLRGRRLCITFGDWHNRDLEEPDRGPDDWRRVDRLTRIYDGFLRGEAWAAGVFMSLERDPDEITNHLGGVDPPGAAQFPC